MPGKLSFGKTFVSLENAINVSEKRHNLISSNISNLDTPNHKGKDIDFKTAMAQAIESDHTVNLTRTNSRHIGLGLNTTYGVESFEQKGEWNGYNWINIDREMTKLIENNLRYRTSVEILLRKIAGMKDAIKEGGH